MQHKPFPLILILIVLILLSGYRIDRHHNRAGLSPAEVATYTIAGFAHGYADSTWLYLDSGDKLGTAFDSVQVLQERFIFRLQSEEFTTPRQYAIRTKSFSDYKLFWMENASLIFSAVKGDFKNAMIDGSVFQRHIESFERLTNPLFILVDSLNRNFGDTDPVVLKKILSLEEELQNTSMRFVEQNASSQADAYLLSLYCRQWGRSNSDKLYQQLSAAAKESVFGQKVKQFIALNKEVEGGSSYVDFILPDQTGTARQLSALKGRYTLLEFWASWCGPCRKENPNLVTLYHEYHSLGFEIVGVSHDVNGEQWKKAIAVDKLPWPNVSALKGSDFDVAQQYGIFEIPTNFLIDPDGKIVAKNLRGTELSVKLKELFGK